MFYSILFMSNVVISITLIAIILIHRGKGSEVGAAFSGATSSLSVFGAKGPDSFLIKVVAVLAFLFFFNALAMIYVAGGKYTDESVIDQFDAEEIMTQPDFEKDELIFDQDDDQDAPVDPAQYDGGDLPLPENDERNTAVEPPT